MARPVAPQLRQSDVMARSEATTPSSVAAPGSHTLASAGEDPGSMNTDIPCRSASAPRHPAACADLTIFIRRCSPAVTTGYLGGLSGPVQVGMQAIGASGFGLAK